MTRLSGLEKNQAPWHLRWSTASCAGCLARISPRRNSKCGCPGWSGVASRWKPALAGNDTFRCVTFSSGKCERAARIGCPF